MPALPSSPVPQILWTHHKLMEALPEDILHIHAFYPDQPPVALIPNRDDPEDEILEGKKELSCKAHHNQGGMTSHPLSQDQDSQTDGDKPVSNTQDHGTQTSHPTAHETASQTDDLLNLTDAEHQFIRGRARAAVQDADTSQQEEQQSPQTRPTTLKHPFAHQDEDEL